MRSSLENNRIREPEKIGRIPDVPAEQAVPAGIRSVPVRRAGGRVEDDFVVVEQPLEIRVDGRPVVVTMRTPGHDEELAAGFLYAEGIIADGGALASVRAVPGQASAGGQVAGQPGPGGQVASEPGGGGQAGGTRLAGFAGDRVEVTLAGQAAAGDDASAHAAAIRASAADTAAPGAGDGASADAAAPAAASGAASGAAAEGPSTPGSGRQFAATAACGVCGKESLDELARLNENLPAVAQGAAASVPVELLETLPGRLRGAQELFDATGGIHAAGIFTPGGERLCVREDVGRHNAVDKVIGHFVLRGAVPLRDHILVVSGRAGFELVQKALRAAIPAMVSVGAASSIAVEMAAGAGMTLYSFAGRGRGNLHVR